MLLEELPSLWFSSNLLAEGNIHKAWVTHSVWGQVQGGRAWLRSENAVEEPLAKGPARPA